MRKPNGYGSIKHLSGNRRRPFVFVISENGRQSPVEYFASQLDAEIFAADYNKLHHGRLLSTHKMNLQSYIIDGCRGIPPTRNHHNRR